MPDIVVMEVVRDPRFLTFWHLGPVVAVQHDYIPHDDSHLEPAWLRHYRGWIRTHSQQVVTFSMQVADEIMSDAPRHPHPSVVGLTSDYPDDQVLAPTSAAERRDFILAGRISPYKNIAIVLQAWEKHQQSQLYRGDELLIFGGGQLPESLPAGVRRAAEQFHYSDMIATLRSSKASLVHYRAASQSGAQVLAMQHGVVPIVSPVGALPDFQPPGEEPIGVDDVRGLAQAFGALADPAAAATRGAAAAAHYQQHYSNTIIAQRLHDVFTDVLNSR